MIGFYNYTVILTYAGLLFTVLGISQAVSGSMIPSIFCLGLALACDMLDGRVAKTKKDRTQSEKLFGIQIDSLCDLISFGVFPAILCYQIGLRRTSGYVILAYYILCCVIRLAYYNVRETQREPDEKPVYHGLPVVGMAAILLAIFLLRNWTADSVMIWILRALPLTFGTLYILDFQIKKLSLWKLICFSLVFWIPLAIICVHGVR